MLLSSPIVPFPVRSAILSNTLVSVISVASFPRVGHGVGQSPLISSRNFGNTSKTMAQITIQLVSS